MLTVGFSVLAFLVAGSGSAAQPKLPGSVWGVAVTGSPAKDVSWKLVSSLQRGSRLNTAVVDLKVLSAPGFVAFRSKARKLNLTLVAPRTAGKSCRACLPTTPSAAVGVDRARAGATILVRLPGPAHVARLRGLKHGRAIAVVRLRGGAAFDKSAWRRAIAAARADARLDLIVAPVGAKAAAGLVAYLELLRSKARTTSPRTAAPSGSAQVWVDTSGGSCVRSASPAAYVDARACSSMNAAYQAATPGDVILIKGGTYPSQTVSDKPSVPLGSASIVMRPAPGEQVALNSLQLYAHDFILDGGDTTGVNEPNRITMRGESSSEESLGMRDNKGSQDGQHRNLVVEDVHIRNVKTSSDYSILRYSEVGPSDMGNGNLCSDLVQTADEPTRGWVIEYNLVHDNKSTGCGGAHIDAFDLYVIDGVIRGNRVWWCGTQCIFTGDPSSILIENNMIEETNACGDGCAGPQELAVMGNNVVRYNTIEGDDGYGRDPDRPGTSTVYGNLFLSPYNRCAGGGKVKVDYSHNVFSPRSIGCGSHYKRCAPRFADGNLYNNTDRQADYHLAPNDTCAIGAGNPSLYPAIDLDRASRPNGPVDAGADER